MFHLNSVWPHWFRVTSMSDWKRVQYNNTKCNYISANAAISSLIDRFSNGSSAFVSAAITWEYGHIDGINNNCPLIEIPLNHSVIQCYANRNSASVLCVHYVLTPFGVNIFSRHLLRLIDIASIDYTLHAMSTMFFFSLRKNYRQYCQCDYRMEPVLISDNDITIIMYFYTKWTYTAGRW